MWVELHYNMIRGGYVAYIHPQEIIQFDVKLGNALKDREAALEKNLYS